MRIYKSLGRDGQGLTEYLILMILISVVSIAAVKPVGNIIKNKFQTVERQIQREINVEGK